MLYWPPSGVVLRRHPMQQSIIQRPEIANTPIPGRASVLASPNSKSTRGGLVSRVCSLCQRRGIGYWMLGVPPRLTFHVLRFTATTSHPSCPPETAWTPAQSSRPRTDQCVPWWRNRQEGALLRRIRTRSPFPASVRVWLPPACHKARKGTAGCWPVRKRWRRPTGR